jgi:hypothetical protein
VYAALLAGAILVSPGKPALAAEGGIGDYLLGSRSVGAGITPPPGLYFQDDTYFYDGKLSAGRTLSTGGLLVGNLSSQTWLNLPTTLWITPAKVFGGDVGVSLTTPFGGPRINAGLLVNSPRFGPIGVNATDDQTNVSDFFLNSFIGWHAGNFHWQVGVGGVIPSGTYVSGQLSNASLNRPAVDVFSTFTWLDPRIGWDLSAAVGVTFNQANTATNYTTGDEFHLEWAATKYITQQFTIGLVGYYYQQFTPDTGAGAVLGPFEGRVVALGGSLGYTFEVGKLPISTRIKIFREFDTVNRQEGTVSYFTVALPLAIDASSAPVPDKAIKTKF